MIGYSLNGLNYLGIASATAEVAGDSFADFRFGGLRFFVEESFGAHDHSGNTETALDRTIRAQESLKLLADHSAISSGIFVLLLY